MRLMLCLILLTLAGCASYAERMAQEPKFTGHTDKTPDEFVACAMPRFLEVMPASRVVPDGESRSIITSDAFNSTIGVAITAYPDGLVAFRGPGPLDSVHEDMWDEVTICL